jgi:hypothetical protein
MGAISQHSFCCHWQPQGHNKQEPTTLILPFGLNKHHPMDKEEFHWLCGVMRRWFSAKLGLKISDVFQQSAQSLWPLTALGDLTNRNQPLLFFHMDPINTILWTRKIFFGSVVSCGVDFQQNLGWKSVMYPNSQHNFCCHWQSWGPNKQEPTTLILPYGSNKHHPMVKDDLFWFCGVMRRWFSAKLGLKISDVPHQSAQFLLPLTAPGT